MPPSGSLFLAFLSLLLLSSPDRHTIRSGERGQSRSARLYLRGQRDREYGETPEACVQGSQSPKSRFSAMKSASGRRVVRRLQRRLGVSRLTAETETLNKFHRDK